MFLDKENGTMVYSFILRALDVPKDFPKGRRKWILVFLDKENGTMVYSFILQPKEKIPLIATTIFTV